MRFEELVSRLRARGGRKYKRKAGSYPQVRNPRALAAWIGRRNLSQAEMTRRSVAARRGGRRAAARIVGGG